MATDVNPFHVRCLSHNHQYSHDNIQPLLHAAPHHDGDIEFELVFHVLSPLPGLEQATSQEIENHLHGLVQSINSDFAGQAYNWDSGRTHQPLFKSSKLLAKFIKQYGAEQCPSRVSEIPTSELAASSNMSEHDLSSDPIWMYQTYLSLKADTGIRFIHTGLQDRIHPQSGVGDRLHVLKLNDPAFASKVGSLVKMSENGGSTAILNVLNIWIVDLPHQLLGFSSFVWDQAGPFDGVCVSNWVSGTKFAEHNGVDYRRYNLYHTFPHEIAHWLGLLHTFNQDIAVDPLTHQARSKHQNDDFVSDTPDQDEATQGNVLEHNHWPVDDRSDALPYQFMNFMDYTNDHSMFMFTRGQRDRLRQVALSCRGHQCTRRRRNGIDLDRDHERQGKQRDKKERPVARPLEPASFMSRIPVECMYNSFQPSSSTWMQWFKSWSPW
ncbi:MAG: zinc metalloprotease [Sylvanvirus sp.]|uniref:Zinc metalloprotease n=1 Tax=Sylvanvirus sp. TaxID=2487774 RepID=A0A3G5AHV3_9VIRU|nr:MAG: zinc metalloprotease [Sylvanvirus sp.]